MFIRDRNTLIENETALPYKEGRIYPPSPSRREAGGEVLPLYEAEMFHQFDHHWATYTEDGNTRDLTDEEKSDRTF